MSWKNKDCTLCDNLTKCRTQIVISTPSSHKGILAIGEAPGADEDMKGEGFCGTAGKTLDRLFGYVGVRRNEYGRANICRCRPPENRKPTKNEINNCLPFLKSLIEDTQPKVLLLVGGTPTSIFFGKGTLSSIITNNTSWEFSKCTTSCHPLLQDTLKYVEHIIPMPHTSPLAFNRNAPWGEKWAKVAERQVALAVLLSKGGAA